MKCEKYSFRFKIKAFALPFHWFGLTQTNLPLLSVLNSKLVMQLILTFRYNSPEMPRTGCGSTEFVDKTTFPNQGGRKTIQIAP
jgi:hypothetical protein